MSARIVTRGESRKRIEAQDAMATSMQATMVAASPQSSAAPSRDNSIYSRVLEKAQEAVNRGDSKLTLTDEESRELGAKALADEAQGRSGGNGNNGGIVASGAEDGNPHVGRVNRTYIGGSIAVPPENYTARASAEWDSKPRDEREGWIGKKEFVAVRARELAAQQ